MSLSLEQVRHVAKLARIALTPDEERRFQEQLSAILDAVEQLRELDTEAVEPTSHAALSAALLREDGAREEISPHEALANAPARVGTYFAVPKILE
jgi:aspartyl-tRNA(Asn)/glutamyl-tRNA(Gln) amidotransferase subunit C